MKNETQTQYLADFFSDYLKGSLRRASGNFLNYFWARVAWYWFPRLGYVSSFPLNVDIEVSSLCNLKCEHCFRQYLNIKDKNNMEMSLYRKIVDECAGEKLQTLKFSMRGEPLMHPGIVEMVAYAKSRGIKEVWINSNGVLLTEDMVVALINAGLDFLTISFDGLGKTYEKIRKPAIFEEQLEKVKMVKKIREKMKKTKPVLKVQTLWSAISSEPDLYYSLMRPVVDLIGINPDMNFIEFSLIHDRNFCCPRLWQRLAITSSGDILRCPSDFEKDDILGNVRNVTIKEVWKGEKMQRLRMIHRERRSYYDDICNRCHHASLKQEKEVSIEGKRVKMMVHKYNSNFKGFGV